VIFSAPLSGARDVKNNRLSRRCPAFAGLRLAIFVVTTWIGPVDDGTGDRGEETGEIFCQILAENRE